MFKTKSALIAYYPPSDTEYRLISLQLELNLFEATKVGGGVLEVDDEELS